MRSRGKDIGKMQAVVRLLANEKLLPERQRDHRLVGDWNDCRECHIEPDWLLIYQIDTERATLTLVRTGTHSDLFDE
jgi:mRNA interferase YafQ